MENFTSLTEVIEKRKLAVTRALEEEAKMLEQMEKQLVLTYTESVKNVASGLLNSIQQEENEQLKELKKQVKLNRLSLIKTRKQLLTYLIPGALALGLIIGILVTLYITK